MRTFATRIPIDLAKVTLALVFSIVYNHARGAFTTRLDISIVEFRFGSAVEAEITSEQRQLYRTLTLTSR